MELLKQKKPTQAVLACLPMLVKKYAAELCDINSITELIQMYPSLGRCSAVSSNQLKSSAINITNCLILPQITNVLFYEKHMTEDSFQEIFVTSSQRLSKLFPHIDQGHESDKLSLFVALDERVQLGQYRNYTKPVSIINVNI